MPCESQPAHRSPAYNNTLSLHQAALAGLGIADLPAYHIAEDLRAGRLQTVLDEFLTMPCTRRGVRCPARVREFVKLVVRQFE